MATAVVMSTRRLRWPGWISYLPFAGSTREAMNFYKDAPVDGYGQWLRSMATVNGYGPGPIPKYAS
jgi:hypothetical protein